MSASVTCTDHDFAGPTHSNALDFLRGQGLTAAKEGCAEGECGACAILIARPDGENGTRWTSVNACLLPAAALDGQEVITAEGLGSVDDVHPVQEEMAVRGGSQCGYCTPGFTCSMAAENYRPEPPTAPDPRPHDPTDDDALAARRSDPAPASAATALHRPDTPTGELGRYRRPTRLAEAVEILSLEPDVLVVAGATDWGVEVNIKGARAKSLLAIDRLPELRGVRWTETHVEIGAANTLSEIERELAGSVPLLGKLFPQFASRLIRNGATIGGNLGTGSPIGA